MTLGKDKLLHFVVGAVAAAVLLILFTSGLAPAWITFISVCLLGLAKEAMDHILKIGSAEVWDAVATVLGGGLIILIAHFLGYA